jgi:hypothetical protein
MILRIEAELVLDAEDERQVANYEGRPGWTRDDALRQVAQDMLGPAGATVIEADA